MDYDLNDPNDVRRIMNILSYKMKEYAANEDIKKGKIPESFKSDIANKTFYFAELTKDDTKKYNRYNKSLSKTLREKWKISNYKVVSQEKLNETIVNGEDPNGFYMIAQKRKPMVASLFIYSLYSGGLAGMIYGLKKHARQTVLSTDDESVVMQFKSYSRFKKGKVLKMQKYLQKKDTYKVLDYIK
ncbi:MAG: hypothetical protein H6553_12750 [Chitinophagales bacterium]|nr:hypothetical protein [Chitinophagales bacterium]